MEKPTLDIHFYIHFPDLEGPEDLGHVLVEEADPVRFVDNRPVFSSFSMIRSTITFTGWASIAAFTTL